MQIGDLPQSQTWYRKAQPIAERQGNPLEALDGLNQVAFFAAGSKMTPDVESKMLKADRLAAQKFGANSPTMGTRLLNLGDFYAKAHDLPKALQSYEKAVTILKSSVSSPEGPNAVELGRAHLHLAECLRDMKRYEEAQPHYQSGLKILSNNPNLGLVYAATMTKAIAGNAEIAVLSKNLDRALTLNQQAIDHFEQTVVPLDWKAVIYRQRARILRLKGRMTEALEFEKTGDGFAEQWQINRNEMTLS